MTMPPEYYAWIKNLEARDTYALGAAIVGAILFTILDLRFWIYDLRFAKDAPRLTHHVSRFTLPAILIIGAALRLLHLGTQSLWYDEAFSALTAQRPLADVLAVAANDYHPPAYFILLWAWSGLWTMLCQWIGGLLFVIQWVNSVENTLPLARLTNYNLAASVTMAFVTYVNSFVTQPADWWLRLPSAGFGLLNVWLVYRLALQFGRPRRESLTAATLMAALPFQLGYSQEARMYEMLLTGCLVTLIGYNSRRWWVVVLAGAVVLYTQSMGVLFLVALGLVGVFDRLRRWPLVLSGLGVVALHAPWLIYGLSSQLGRMGGGHYWIPQVTPGAWLYLWHVLQFHEANPLPVILGMPVSLLLALAAVVTGLRQRLFNLVALMLSPPLLAVPVSLALSPVLLPRTFITVTPALYILIAAALWSFKGWRRWGLFGVWGLLLAVALWGFYTDPKLQKWPQRDWAVEMITNRYQPGDAVLYLPQSLPFLWYLPQDIPQYFLPQDETALNAGFNLTNEAAAALGLVYARPEDLREYKRLFVVYGRSPATGQYQETAWRELSHTYPVLWQHTFVEDKGVLAGAIALLDFQKGE
jgi:uncharacterized membrane protein